MLDCKKSATFAHWLTIVKRSPRTFAIVEKSASCYPVFRAHCNPPTRGAAPTTRAVTGSNLS